MEIELTKENYDGEVIKSNMPVLVDFWASWCGPCKMVAPIISQIAEEYNGKVKVCKVNVDDQGELVRSKCYCFNTDCNFIYRRQTC